MNLKQKKDHILRCVKLGMELFRAELVAECTQKEIDLIDKDIIFLERVKQYHALEEYDLLVKHNNALNIGVLEGKVNAVQWKLERINPGRWGKDESAIPKDIPNLRISLVGKEPEKKNNGSCS